MCSLRTLGYNLQGFVSENLVASVSFFVSDVNANAWKKHQRQAEISSQACWTTSIIQTEPESGKKHTKVHLTAEHVGTWKGFLRELLVCSAACPSFIKLWCPRPRPMVSKLEAKALSERGPKSLHWTHCTQLLLIKAARRTSRMVFPNHDLTSMSLGRT